MVVDALRVSPESSDPAKSCRPVAGFITPAGGSAGASIPIMVVS